MGARYAAAVAIVLLVPALWTGAGRPAAVASAQAAPLAAALRPGSCENPGPLANFVLNPVERWAPPSPPGDPIRYGETALPVPLADILSTPHAVVLTPGGDARTILACGDLGPGADERQPAVGLRERNGSGVAGVAWFTASGEATTASVAALEGLRGADAPAPAPPGLPMAAAIVGGSCAEPGPGPTIALAPVLPWAPPVLLGVTDVPTPLADLVAEPRAIVVALGAVDGPPLACGELGGAVDGENLAVGLREQNGSGLIGFAWLNGATATTSVSVIAGQDLMGDGAPPSPPPAASSPGPATPPVDEPTATPTAAPASPTATIEPTVSAPAATPAPAAPIRVPGSPTAAPPEIPPAATPAVTTYTSDQFDYSITYGPEWSVAAQEREPGLDYLLLSNGTSSVDFLGRAGDRTAPQCLDDLYEGWLLERPALRSVAPHAGVDAGLVERADEQAIEVWDVSFEDAGGRVTEATIYARCTVLGPGRGTFLTSHEAPRAAYPTERDRREALYAGLVLP